MWFKFFKNIGLLNSFRSTKHVNVTKLYSILVDDSTLSESTNIQFDTMYWIHQFKRDFFEVQLAKNINRLYLKNFIDLLVSFKHISSIGFVGYTQLESIYQKYFGFKRLNRSHDFVTIIFDLKKKQLYSSLYENLFLKKFLTNGLLLKQLNIQVKYEKKNLSTYNLNIRKFVGDTSNLNCVLEIIGCKNSIFKIISFIKKYHNKNAIFIFTPRRSFFANQYKRLRSIKRRSFKRNVRNLLF